MKKRAKICLKELTIMHTSVINPIQRPIKKFPNHYERPFLIYPI